MISGLSDYDFSPLHLTIVKNRGGKLGEPVFKYSRALHDFVPIDFQVEINPDSEDI